MPGAPRPSALLRLAGLVLAVSAVAEQPNISRDESSHPLQTKMPTRDESSRRLQIKMPLSAAGVTRSGRPPNLQGAMLKPVPSSHASEPSAPSLSQAPLPELHGATTPYAILAAADTGSSWVDGMLGSHPCVVTSMEYLGFRTQQAKHSFSSTPDIVNVLRDIEAVNRAQLVRLQHNCSHTAAGVKLQVGREVTSENGARVGEALRTLGWSVVSLVRSNGLEHYLGDLFRATNHGAHCRVAYKGGPQTKCDPGTFNFSLALNCTATVSHIQRHQRLTSLQRSWLPGSLEVGYEQLLESPAQWFAMMRLLGPFSETDACLLQPQIQKHVQQTQREVITNYQATSECLTSAGFAALLRPDYRPAPGPLPSEAGAPCVQY